MKRLAYNLAEKMPRAWSLATPTAISLNKRGNTVPGSSLTWVLSPSTQSLALSTYATVSLQDESHFLKNIKTARCRAAVPLLKVSAAEGRLAPDPQGAEMHCALFGLDRGPRGAGAAGHGHDLALTQGILLRTSVPDSLFFLTSC